ncbi:MAG: aminoacyl-histidine dipeptidase [Bacteroidota bacterium]|nr:aminoacyl-histidine dipeptidase [Bacteroidota bacterium]MDX5430218.1 aminoacyl-histidine dipeptidase [Bacteroidota bacterium]MDX5468980.1 aminoacyl-histidine dipeptidase [Bacteroidota bacterium]
MNYTDLQPQAVWEHFAQLNAIPRGSKKEEKAAQFVADFGALLGLEVLRDDIGNVIIKKPGQNGGENSDPVILQSHVDMVHQKNADTVFDFDTEGIRMHVDGEWVKADGTTLGADNGMGVAYMMTVLKDKNLKHPPIEALFTIDEEAGMTGAKNLGAGLLSGKRLLNIDTEDDEEITIGCAGGIDTNVELEFRMEDTPENTKAYFISVKGLAGGHSGMDIDLGRGNANKILFRLLFQGYSRFGMRIASVDGGGLRNAIPREAFATVVVDIQKTGEFETHLLQLGNAIKTELRTMEPNLEILWESTANPVQVMNVTTQVNIIRAIYSMPNGVYRMSAEVKGLVETSSNLARVLIKDGKFKSQSLQRSSVESSKMDIANAIRACFEQIGCLVENGGDYPGWKPNPDSPLLEKAVALHREVFKREPKVAACHAGLETGIITGVYPGLDMISIGPTIKHPHSPDEKVNIRSVEAFWKYFTNLLETL